jgi:hypothetical protein
VQKKIHLINYLSVNVLSPASGGSEKCRKRQSDEQRLGGSKGADKGGNFGHVTVVMGLIWAIAFESASALTVREWPSKRDFLIYFILILNLFPIFECYI